MINGGNTIQIQCVFSLQGTSDAIGNFERLTFQGHFLFPFVKDIDHRGLSVGSSRCDRMPLHGKTTTKETFITHNTAHQEFVVVGVKLWEPRFFYFERIGGGGEFVGKLPINRRLEIAVIGQRGRIYAVGIYI